MSAVQIERVPNGFAVTRHFRSWAAASCGADRLFSVCEEAFEPVAQHAPVDPAVRLAVQIERAESDDDSPGDAWPNPVSQDAE